MTLAGEQLAGAPRPAGVGRLGTLAPRRHQVALAIGIALVAIAAVAAVLALPEVRGIYLWGLYAVPSNSLAPIPHEPGLLYFAQFHHPLWLALAGSLGAGAGAVSDYYFVGRAMTIPRLSRLRDSRIYKLAVRWLMRRPFLTIVCFAGLPLPIVVVRVLSPMHGYPLRYYAPAVMIGRFPRFFVVAWIGAALSIPAWLALALFAGLVTLGIVVGWLRSREP